MGVSGEVQLNAGEERWRMDPRQVELVQETFPLLHGRSEAAAAVFYATLFAIEPDLSPMFHTELVEQGDKLMAMLAVAVYGLGNVEMIAPGLRQLGWRHVGYGVEARHYAIVRKALLETARHFLGKAFTYEVERAWSAGYDLLAGLMLEGAAGRGIERER